MTNDAQIAKSPSMDNLMSNNNENGGGSGVGGSNSSSSPSSRANNRLLAPNANQMKRKLVGPLQSQAGLMRPFGGGGGGAGVKEKFVAEIFEIRLNPIVSKRGYLNFLEEKSIGWTKKYVV